MALAWLAQPILEERSHRRAMVRIGELGGTISLGGNEPRDSSLARQIVAIFDSSYRSHWPRNRVNLAEKPVTDADLSQIAKLQVIERLNLSGAQITDTGVMHLEEMPYLRELNLSHTAITDVGVSHLAGATELRWLSTVGTGVSCEALARLDAKLTFAHFVEQRAIDELKAAGFGVLTKTRTIQVGGVHEMAGELAYQLIAGQPYEMAVTSAHITHLNRLSSLERASFHRVAFEEGALPALMSLPKLRSLQFYIANLTDRDLASLAGQVALVDLVLVEAGPITDNGIAALIALSGLRTLNVSGCPHVTLAAVDQLRRQLPDCKVSFQAAPNSGDTSKDSAALGKGRF
jgi:hypothetical protein